MQHAIRVAALFVLLAFGAIPAHAQSFSIVELPGGCGTGNITSNSLSYLTVDSGLKLCVNATATLGGFTATATGTPISVTTGGVSGTLPAGAEVVATNVGTTNGAYCALGASATTSSQYIAPNGGWFAFAVGASTQLTCITSTSTTTVNTTGGSGLPTGTGGGGGGSSANASVSATGSGVPASATYAGMNVSGNLTGLTGTANGLKVDGSAVTQPVSGPTAVGTAAANPPVLAGGTADGTATGAVGVATIKAGNTAGTTDKAIVTADANVLAALALATPAGTNRIGYDTDDPCDGAATKSRLPITVTTSAVKVIATGVSAKKIYVCHLLLSSGAADEVAVFEATTGTTCATSAIAVIGGGTSVATAANGLQFAANGGVSLGNGRGAIAQTTVNNNDLCVGTSAATPLSGVITYVTQ